MKAINNVGKIVEHLILVAEDDPDDQLLLKDAFKAAQFSAPVFLDNGKLLLDYLQDVTQPIPHLIIVDLNMPLIDGRGVINVIKNDSQLLHIPIIVLSTTKNKEDIHSLYELGIAEFFTKPSSFSALVTITRSIITKWLNQDQTTII